METKKKYFLINSDGSSIDPDYAALLARGTALGYSLPNASDQAKGNTLIKTLKSAGIWSKLDTFYVFRTSGDVNFALLNWKSPTTFQITRVASCTFISGQGFKGNGTTMYLDTGFSMFTNGVQCALNSYGILSAVYNNATDTTMLYGTNDASSTPRTSLRPRNASNVPEVYMNATFGNISGSTTDSSGLWHIYRTSSTSYKIYQNASLLATGSDTGGASMATSNIYLLARNNNGALANQNSTWIISCWGIGATMSGLESAANSAWTAYIS